MDELMMGVGSKVRGLSPPCDHHAGTVLRHPRLHLHRRRQVHEQADGGDRALGVVHQSHELSEVGPAPEVDRPGNNRMLVVGLPDLDELDPAAKVLHDLSGSAPAPTT